MCLRSLSRTEWGARTLALAAGLLAVARSSGAQSTEFLGTVTAAPFLGIARNSPATGNWGTTPDRDHYFLGVHLTAPVLRVGAVMLSYAPNIVPLVIVTNNPRYEVTRFTDGGVAVDETGRGPVIGAGLSPLGLQLGVDLARRLNVYAAGAVGGLWFADAVPELDARKFNYTFEYGGGVTYSLQPQRSIQLGYKFHHLSNLYTAEFNPGLDGHVFYAGIQWQARMRRE